MSKARITNGELTAVLNAVSELVEAAKNVGEVRWTEDEEMLRGLYAAELNTSLKHLHQHLRKHLEVVV